MAYKFKVGQESVNAVLEELQKLGQQNDLDATLKNFGAGTEIDVNGSLRQTDPDLHTFSARSKLELDSATLEAVQDVITRNGLDNQSPLLARVLKANPTKCVPPYDCGETILN